MTDEQKGQENQVTVSPVDVPDFSQTVAPSNHPLKGIGFLKDVPVTIAVELGRIHMNIEDVLLLGPGSLVTLKRQVNEPVDLYVNDKLIGHGEIVAVDDYFGIRITEIKETAQEDTST